MEDRRSNMLVLSSLAAWGWLDLWTDLTDSHEMVVTWR